MVTDDSHRVAHPAPVLARHGDISASGRARRSISPVRPAAGRPPGSRRPSAFLDGGSARPFAAVSVGLSL
jgi:hypothetical protein